MSYTLDFIVIRQLHRRPSPRDFLLSEMAAIDRSQFSTRFGQFPCVVTGSTSECPDM